MPRVVGISLLMKISADNSLQFQVTTALPAESGQAPSDSDCISIYDPGSGLLLIPAVKSSQEANSAAYKNVQMNLQSALELIFKLESVETVP